MGHRDGWSSISYPVSDEEASQNLFGLDVTMETSISVKESYHDVGAPV